MIKATNWSLPDRVVGFGLAVWLVSSHVSGGQGMGCLETRGGPIPRGLISLHGGARRHDFTRRLDVIPWFV